ncbi:MAG TPA: 2-phosphosulfolactate phosphatase [Herpetosiphon sp.]|uniref:Probable 2-phosphosulfolactate phosphatase n=1 Tax=Herpetosiphon aurantiacus (strain ATCC 23779 / DSM 785 / 114-95) TaxID=316274 RepID=A9B4P8_HERA2|nr:2-phosphosulfolactate phosphatase [Herpetosiphon sp.]ABX04213.1 2-phosphosulfolactate phosphatase [Herpetosiphon aurantiacus DSM 785]HBW51364.1 2-phosphosulfolactate phosphatase [Herpetosiphon sp.]
MVVIDFDPSSAQRYVNQGFNIVTVDVLRASSTITVGLARGAAEIIPCVTVDEAFALKQRHDAILVGERNAVIVAGFDYTNSPYDLEQTDLTGRIMVITTSTGTRLIAESMGAAHILIGTTINARAVANKMAQLGNQWAIIGAGTRGEFRPEDKVGCAVIAQYFLQVTGETTDSATQAFIDEFGSNSYEHISQSPSTIKLLSLGRACDVDFVLNHPDAFEIVPQVILKQAADAAYLSIVQA